MDFNQKAENFKSYDNIAAATVTFGVIVAAVAETDVIQLAGFVLAASAYVLYDTFVLNEYRKERRRTERAELKAEVLAEVRDMKLS